MVRMLVVNMRSQIVPRTILVVTVNAALHFGINFTKNVFPDYVHCELQLMESQ